MILDTSYIVTIKPQDGDALALSKEHDVANIPQRLPATVLSKLSVSVGAGNTLHGNVRAYKQLVGNLAIVDTDQSIARRAGVIRSF